MTYLTKTLNEICKKYCPICTMCSIEHECRNIRAIKDKIIKIMSEEINDN